MFIGKFHFYIIFIVRNTLIHEKGELLDGIRLKSNINNIGVNSINDINNMGNIRPNNNSGNIGINLINKALNPKLDVKKSWYYT